MLLPLIRHLPSVPCVPHCPSQVILFWRGVWNSWDSLFGTELASNIGSMAVGLVIMCVIRLFNLPLVEGLPGG